MTLVGTTLTASDTWAQHNAAPAGQRLWPSEELIRAVARRGDVGAAVEVGCGNGANLWFLAEHAVSVAGVDLDATVLLRAAEYAMCRTPVHYQLYHGSATALPLPDACADLVVDCMCSQHLPWAEHAAAYREYRRLLRPGGWLFLYHLSSKTSGGSEWLRPPDVQHLDLFPAAGLTCLPRPDALAAEVAAAGFSVGDVRGLSRTYPGGAVADYIVMEADAR